MKGFRLNKNKNYVLKIIDGIEKKEGQNANYLSH